MRADLDIVAGLIPRQGRILDLGCGDGQLLAEVARRGGTGTGVDHDPGAISAALSRGVNVVQLNIDHEMGEFADNSYDCVVVSQTLQATRRPDELLAQIRRIAPLAAVSVPNFGLWQHRWSLAVRGRMPVSDAIPYTWFETPNIHLATLFDLERLFAAQGWQLQTRVLLDGDGHAAPSWRERRPNLLAAGAVYLLARLSS